MAPAPSPLFTGSPSSPPPQLSLHLLSIVTMASASADSDMDTPVGDESPPSDPPPPPSSLPSPSPPPSKPQSAPSAPPSRPMPVREDCWSEEATATLIEAWGDRYVELNKGNLRQKHWQEVADAVNAAHGHTKKTRRTDIQCKNRIDTIKKKYKIEKAKTVESRAAYVSPWPFFSRLDSLIGDTAVKKFSTSTPSPAPATADLLRRKPSAAARSSSPCRALALTSPVPVGPRSAKPKRPAAMDDSFFRRTFAAAAAAASESEDEDGDNDREEPETSRSSGAGSRRRGWRKESSGGGGGGASNDGCRQLAEAITKFGEIYERVEGMKQEQMIELEKHRMQFAKELEFQRMKLLMDTQLQLAKIKRMKPSNDADADADSY